MLDFNNVTDMSFNGKPITKIEGATQGVIWEKAADLPYLPIEYIKATGQQYIRTGVIPNDTAEMYADFTSTVNKTMFISGSRYAFNQKAFCLADNWYAKTDGYLFQYNNVSKSNQTVAQYQRTKALLRKNNSLINGNFIGTNFLTLSSTYEVYLGTINQNNTPETRTFEGLIYEFYIDKDGVRQVHYIPCIDKESGKAGFWDLISDSFKCSDSGVDFLAPEDVMIASVNMLNSIGIEPTNDLATNIQMINGAGVSF